MYGESIARAAVCMSKVSAMFLCARLSPISRVCLISYVAVWFVSFVSGKPLVCLGAGVWAHRCIGISPCFWVSVSYVSGCVSLVCLDGSLLVGMGVSCLSLHSPSTPQPGPSVLMVV